MRPRLAIVALTAALLGAAPSGAAASSVVVRYRPGADVARRAAGVGALAARRLAFLPRTEVLRLPAGADPRAAAARLERDPAVAYAEPEIVYHGATVPDDPLFGAQWALRNTGQPLLDSTGTPGADIAAPAAWDLTTGDPGTLVAVVDSGVADSHPDLAANAWTNPGETGGGREANGVDDDGDGFTDDWRGWDWVGDDNAPDDAMGHGTHVAGIIAARGGDAAGMAGIAWQARVLSLRVLDDHDAGSSVDIAAAFAYAARKGARVVNASILGAPSQLVDDVVKAHPETLFVAAAGNSGQDVTSSPVYPCTLPYDNVVCVAATDENDALAPFSNHGASRVDIAAPGVNILSTQPGLRTVLADDFEGTSHFGPGWGVTAEHASSGTHALADSPNADYANSSTTTADASFDTSGLSGCRLEYRLWLDLADAGDRFRIIGTDLTTGTQDVVGTVTGPAHLAGVYRHSFLLDLQHPARLRLELTGNASGRAAGAAIDDVRVRCIDPALAPSLSDYDDFSGTSMAAPMVSGAAALAFSRNPAMTAVGVRDALVAAAAHRPSLDGRVASGRLDARATLDRIPAPAASAPPPGTPAANQSIAVPPASSAPRVPLRRRHITLSVGGHRTRSGLVVTRLTLRSPRAAGAIVTCAGRRCPFTRRTLSREAAGDALGADTQRRLLRAATLLRAGTRLTVVLTRGSDRVRLTLRIGSRGSRVLSRACAGAPPAPFARCPA